MYMCIHYLYISYKMCIFHRNVAFKRRILRHWKSCKHVCVSMCFVVVCVWRTVSTHKSALKINKKSSMNCANCKGCSNSVASSFSIYLYLFRSLRLSLSLSLASHTVSLCPCLCVFFIGLYGSHTDVYWPLSAAIVGTLRQLC